MFAKGARFWCAIRIEMKMGGYIDLKKFCASAGAAFPANHLFCVGDQAGIPGLLSEIRNANLPWRSLFDGTSEQRALKVAPLVFSVDEQSCKNCSYFFEWLARYGTYTSSLLFLSSCLELDELKRRLALRLRAQVSEKMDVLLRYFDPRVFEALVTILNETQRSEFLGVGDCWWYLNRRGEMISVSGEYDAANSFQSPLRLSARQEFSMLDASEVDQVAAHLQFLMPDRYMSVEAPMRHSFLVRHIAAARGMGILTSNELSLYCGLALLYGDDFAQQSSWRTLLEKVRTGASSLSDAVTHAKI